MLAPTKEAGVFIVAATGQKIRLTEWEEQDAWDCNALPATTDLLNLKISFFAGNQGNGGRKTDRDTNITKPNQLTSYNEMIVLRPWLMVEVAWGTATANLADQQAIYGGGMLEVLKNNRPIITNSHCYRFSSGYGLVGYGIDDAAGATSGIAPGGSGVAGTAAQSPLLVPFQLVDNDQFGAALTFPGSNAGISGIAGGVSVDPPVWAAYGLSADVDVMVGLHGFMKRPATS